jgi:hypothetical protein
MRRMTLAFLILAAACSQNKADLFPRPGGDRVLPQGHPAASEERFAQKVVNAKEEPATLIASDRTRCVVTAQKFKETLQGSKVWCAWR